MKNSIVGGEMLIVFLCAFAALREKKKPEPSGDRDGRGKERKGME